MSEPEPVIRKKPGRKTGPPPEGAHAWAANLRAARESASMSVRELALACGLEPARVARYDAGDREPSVSAALALARALSTTVEELFG